MEKLTVRYAKREELESVNRIRKQVNDVRVTGRPDIFREDGWQRCSISRSRNPLIVRRGAIIYHLNPHQHFKNEMPK